MKQELLKMFKYFIIFSLGLFLGYLLHCWGLTNGVI